MNVFYKCCVTAVASLFVIASILRSNGLFLGDIYWAQEYLGGDKVTHIIAGASITHTMQVWFNHPIRLWRSFWLCLGLSVILLCEELSQHFLLSATRNFSFNDFVASFSGVSIVTVMCFWYVWIKPAPKS